MQCSAFVHMGAIEQANARFQTMYCMTLNPARLRKFGPSCKLSTVVNIGVLVTVPIRARAG